MRRLPIILLFCVACAESDARQLVVHLRTSLPSTRLEQLTVDLTVDGEPRDGATLSRTPEDRGELGSIGVVPDGGADAPTVELSVSGTIDGGAFRQNYTFNSFHQNERTPVFICVDGDDLCDPTADCAATPLPGHGVFGEDWSACLVSAAGSESPPDDDTLTDGTAYTLSVGGPGDQSPTGIIRTRGGMDIVVGQFSSSLDLDGPRVADGVDGFVVALDASGAVVWSLWLTGPGDDAAVAIAADEQGNIVVAGTFEQTMTVVAGEAVVDTISARGGSDIFVMTVNEEGRVRSSTVFGSTSNDAAVAIAIASMPEGSTIVVAGSQAGPFNVETNGACRWQRRDDVPPKNIIQDGFLMALDDALSCEWGITLAGDEHVSIDAVAIESSGGVVLAGRTAGALSLPGELESRGVSFAASADGQDDAFVMTLQDGDPRSAVQIAGPGNDRVRSIGRHVTATTILVAGEFERGVRRLDATRTIGTPSTQILGVAFERNLGLAWTLTANEDADVASCVATSAVDGSSWLIAKFTGTLDLETAEPLTASIEQPAVVKIGIGRGGDVRAAAIIARGEAKPLGIDAGDEGETTIVGDYTGALDVQGLGMAQARDGFVIRR